MKIVVVDGQGGSIGASLVGKIKKRLDGAQVCGIGVNYFASKLMKKAGSDLMATGENAIKVNVADADFILGTSGIVIANSLQGEISPKISKAIGKSRAIKILIPFDCSNTYIIGSSDKSLEENIERAVDKLIEIIEK
ncbi:MAG: DUF3842 family protein [Anaerococcus sp.]|nr:DUF3842 family protein [Anaerococcus sp.]